MNIVVRRKIWYIISLAIIVPGIFSLIFQGLNLGIDFTGGNLMQIKAEDEISSEQVKSVLRKLEVDDYSVREAGKGEFLVRTSALTEEENRRLIKELNSEAGNLEILRNEKVAPVIGRELSRNAMFSLLVAAVLMVAYITIRFEIYFAIAAIIALLHDVLITLSLFSFLQLKVESAFIAALLTIIGYSINDTIVIFDRIRENISIKQKETKDKKDFAQIIDLSVRQTLRRSISTSMTVIIILLSLIILGGETTRVFAIALLIGTVAGTYSSIFTASPLWYDLIKSSHKYKNASQVHAH